jgi:uncharacterized protein (TIGR03437 family)
MSISSRRWAFAAVVCNLLLASTSVAPAQDGTGPLVDQRFYDLKYNSVLSAVPEIPTDESPLPADWLALVCWNVQVGGVSTSPTATRPPMVRDALHKMFGGSYQVLAAEEVSSTDNADVMIELLPGSGPEWKYSFFDSTDTMDNGIWYRRSVVLGASAPLFVTAEANSAGKIVTDPTRALHPPIAAHVAVGDFDFTLINIHLRFDDGDTEQAARELRVLLDYLDSYFQQPGHDPDVIICGDFNTPSLLSGQRGKGGITVDGVIDADPRFQTGERRLAVAVHEPTSRTSAANGGEPANNYDHFIFSADVMEELVQARRVSTNILTDHALDPEQALTSDHFPIVSFFRTRGPDVHRDLPLYTMVRSVVSSASYVEGIVSGSWVTLFGQDLAPTTRPWRGDEIIDGVLPQQLDGVRVSIAGRPSAVYYVSPTQLNVQAPDDLPEGPVEVQVTRDDVTAARFTGTVRRYSPGFFLFEQGGNRYLAAVHALPESGRVIYVGRRDLFGGVLPARPVRAGDQVLLFGTGFGPTSPPVPAGRVFVGAAPLTRPVRIRFGGRDATVLFAGISGAGLYQFNVVVPDGLPSGDVPVVAEIEGVTAQSGAFVTVE